MLGGFKLDCLDQTSFLASLPSAAMFPFPHPLSAFAQQQCSCSLTPLCFSSLTAMFLFPLLLCAFPVLRSNVPVPSPTQCFCSPATLLCPHLLLTSPVSGTALRPSLPQGPFCASEDGSRKRKIPCISS